jgi:hypothetical protein
MNRLNSSNRPVSESPAGAGETPLTPVARSVREPSLLRLAQSIEELNPELARALCLSGLAAMEDPAEREAWRARLAPWLDNRDGEDGGPALAAA